MQPKFNIEINVAVRNKDEVDFIEATSAVIRTFVETYGLNLDTLSFNRKSGWAGVRSSRCKTCINRETRKVEFWVNIKECKMTPETVQYLAYQLLLGTRWADFKNNKVKNDFTEFDLLMCKNPEKLSKTRTGKIKKEEKENLACERYARNIICNHFKDNNINFDTLKKYEEVIE